MAQQAKFPACHPCALHLTQVQPRPLPVSPLAPSAPSPHRPLVVLAAVAAIGNSSWCRRREVLLGPVVPLLGPKVAEAKALKAPEVVRELWGKGLRTGEDLSQWKQLLAADCVYEDLYYQDAAKGKDEVLKLIGQKLLPSNSQLIIDDISDGQKSCGFTWHIEEKGVGIGQRGIGYVRLNSAGEVVYVRDLGEPLFKAGELTEKLLEALTKDQPIPERPATGPPQTPRTAGAIVKYLYGDVQKAGGDAARFYADDVIYEDMNYETPFIGQSAVEGFLKRFQNIQGVTFNLEEVSDGDQAVGFTYTIEIAGQPRGIRGITYYQVNDFGKVCYVRDVPESASKPPPVQQLARLLRRGLQKLQPAQPFPAHCECCK